MPRRPLYDIYIRNSMTGATTRYIAPSAKDATAAINLHYGNEHFITEPSLSNFITKGREASPKRFWTLTIDRIPPPTPPPTTPPPTAATTTK